MIKKSKKIISIVLALMMVLSCFTVLTVNAATTDENVSSALASVYQTNPNGAAGKKASITIDGSFSDWTADMKIAQSGAWDVANNWKGAHENCVLDTTGLYAAWDDQNLYVAWQMVNITDTFWREGDGPLSDGGRVLDVPLILALSVDPSSTSLNNKVTDGNKIWGVDIEFDTHVDHLFYMSGKVGLGTPAMFTAADSSGTTNYTSACKNFKDTGIKYALAEGNIESSIIGLDGSQSPDDVTSDASNWVDFKTHQGSYGVHDTSYDSFYEMSIPLSALGIDANYLETNGIGAMVVASRGESGLDCTPYDLCMIDNATGDYASDSSTSHEKDDSDVITSQFARIGSGNPNPTTATTQPTTVATDATTAPTTATVPVVSTNNLNVNVTSNLCDTITKTYSADEKTVTVTANLESSNKIVDGEIYIKYDPTKLKIADSNYDEDLNPIITPTITAVGGEIVNMAYAEDTICVTFTNTKKYNFTTSKPLVQITFDVIGTGDTTVDVNVEELDCVLTGSNTPVILVKDGVPADLYNTTCKTTTSISAATIEPSTDPTTPTTPVTDPTDPTEAPTTITDPTDPDDPETLDVKVTSNLTNAVSDVYGTSDKVTITYNLESSNKIVDGEIYIKYDPTKLKIADSNYDEDLNPIITPTITAVGGEIVNMAYAEDTICVTFTNTKKYNFTTSKPLVQITFDIVGSGETTVHFDVNELDCVLTGSNTPVILVKDSVPVDLYNTTCKTTTSLSDATIEPSTDPTTPTTPVTDPTDPTEAPTTITDPTDPDDPETLDVKVTSNLANAVSDVYGTSNKVTITYNLESSNKIVDGEIYIKYDPTKLKIADSNYDEDLNPIITPTITAVGGEIVNMVYAEDTICVTFTNTKKYNFTTKSPLVQITFDIVGSGETTVHFDVNELDCVLTGSNTPVILVKDSVPAELYDTTCKSEIVLNEPAPLPTTPDVGENDIKVIAKSNIANRQTNVYSTTSNKQVTVTYLLKSDQKFNAAEWRLIYDPAMLKFASANYDANGDIKVMPVADGTGVVVTNLPEAGRLRGTFASSANDYDFTTQGKLVEVTFDILGTGTTTVNLYMDVLSYLSADNAPITMVEDTAITSAYKAEGTAQLSEPVPAVDPSTPTNPTVLPTDPTTPVTDPTDPTEAPTNPTVLPTDPDDPETLDVKVTSNLANAVSDVYGTSDKVIITYNLESSNKIVDGEIYIKYDPTKLKIADSNYDEDLNPIITPTITAVGGEIVNMAYAEDTICVTFTNTKKYNFTTKSPLVQITFDIVGSGETTVHFDVNELDCVLTGSNTPVILVKDSVPAELYDTTCKSEIVLNEPAPLPTTPVTDPTDPTNPTEPTTLLGDADGDGFINIKDASYVQEHVARYRTLTGTAAKNADVDLTGDINIIDASNIQMYVAKYISDFKEVQK